MVSEKKLLEEHPSLKGKVEFAAKDLIYISPTIIHETQLDKQKVEEVIDKKIKEWSHTCEEDDADDMNDSMYVNDLNKIKKELEL